MDRENIKITLLKNGSLKIEGEVKIVDDSDHLIKEGNRFFMCRCGSSNNKPFCDASHKKVNFQS